MSETEFASGAAETIPEHVAENYRQLVADENRNLNFNDLAEQAAKANDPALAAWARSEASKSGKDVTPHGAQGSDSSEHREYGKLLLTDLQELVAQRSGIDASELKLKADFVAALELDDEKNTVGGAAAADSTGAAGAGDDSGAGE